MLSGLIFAAAGIRICLVFKAQGAGGVMVLGISFWLLSTIWASFKYHSLPAYLLLTMSIPLYLKCPHLVIAAYSWTTQHVTKHNVISNCFFFWKWQWVQFTPQSPDRNSVEHLCRCDRMEDSHLQILSFSSKCWIYNMKNGGSSDAERGFSQGSALCT